MSRFKPVVALCVVALGLPTSCALLNPNGDLVGSWFDARGVRVADGSPEFGGKVIIRSFWGAPSCAGPEVPYLELRSPGSSPDAEELRYFVRQTVDDPVDPSRGFDPDAAVPARTTGPAYFREGNRVVFDQEDHPVVVRRSGKAEVWPETKLACA